jgi:5-formyltetrahydrofolate cyclo-ligase
MDDTTTVDAVVRSKAELRRSMRSLRRALEDRDARSVRLWQRVQALPSVATAERVLVFTTIVGEPDTAPFVRWCERYGKLTAVPEEAVDVDWPDVAIVPGLAITRAGHRLGQGGGWYDRFLDRVPARCTTIGVGFAPQVLDALPIEPHDVTLQYVVTDRDVWCR